MEMFRPNLIADPTLASPGAETMGEVLAADLFADLYRLVKEDGLPYFARLNGKGDVELYLVFESIDAFSQSTRDAVSLEFKTYQNKLLAVIWTLQDPIDPLGFPLSFDIRRTEDRFMALRLLEQTEISVHYLAFEADMLTHIFSEAITLSAREKAEAEGYIRRLYAAENDETAPADEAEIREQPIATIPAASISEKVLLQDGLAYLLDYQAMAGKHGEEGAQNLLMSTVQQAMLVIRRHSRSQVRESSFTVWAAEQEGLLTLIVTPGLLDLFEAAHSSEDETNPFSRFLFALPEFLETREESPLRIGAFPILRYQAGKLFHLDLDESTQALLAELFERKLFAADNPYVMR